jgi:hypothetical protein
MWTRVAPTNSEGAEGRGREYNSAQKDDSKRKGVWKRMLDDPRIANSLKSCRNVEKILFTCRTLL